MSKQRVYVEGLGWCTLTSTPTEGLEGGVWQSLDFVFGTAEASADVEITYVNDELVSDLVASAQAEAAYRKAFLEKWTGLPVEVVDE